MKSSTKPSAGSQSDKLKHALWYAGKGIYVFPLAYDKKTPPYRMMWKEEATIDPEKIKGWWKENASYNIGVAPEPSGLVIIDLDDKNGKTGTKEWAKLIGNRETRTLTVKTPSGGKHLYFYGDPTKSGTDRLGEGVDVKSVGGYVVGIGSTFDGKKYHATGKTNTVAVAPKYLRELLAEYKPRREVSAVTGLELDLPTSIEAAKDYLDREDPAVQGAGGDEFTYRVACRVIDHGLSRAAAHDLMLENWNDRCQPPWDADELYGKVRNAFSYRQNDIGVDSPELAFEGLESLRSKDKTAADNDNTTVKRSKTWLTSRGISLKLKRDKEGRPPKVYLFGKLLPIGELFILIGDGGTGKTFLGLQMQACLASGTPFLGLKCDKPLQTFGFYSEDSQDLLDDRVHGICQALKIDQDSPVFRNNMHYYSAAEETGKTLYDARAGKSKGEPTEKGLELFAEIERQQQLGNAVGLLAIDNTAHVHDGSEIDRRQVSRFEGWLQSEATRLGLSVLLFAHTPKYTDGETRHKASGSTAVQNAARGAISLEYYDPRDPKDPRRTLKTVKNNALPPIEWVRDLVIELEGGVFSLATEETHAELSKLGQEIVDTIAAEPPGRFSVKATTLQDMLAKCVVVERGRRFDQDSLSFRKDWRAVEAEIRHLLVSGHVVTEYLPPPGVTKASKCRDSFAVGDPAKAAFIDLDKHPFPFEPGDQPNSDAPNNSADPDNACQSDSGDLAA